MYYVIFFNLDITNSDAFGKFYEKKEVDTTFSLFEEGHIHIPAFPFQIFKGKRYSAGCWSPFHCNTS